MSSNEPSQTSGQFHSVKGTAVEAVGNLTGSTEWQKSGKAEHAQGEGEIKAAQAKAYAEGLSDQATGYVKNVTGALTGDSAKQAEGATQKKAGEAQKEVNKPT